MNQDYSPTRNHQLEKVQEATPVTASPYQSNYGADYEEESDWHLRDYLHTMRKRARLIVLVALVTVATAALFIARQPDQYEARARVQVDMESNPAAFGNAGGGTGPLVVNGPVNDPAYFNTQLQILTSPGLLRRVVKTLDLEHSQPFLDTKQAQNPWQNMMRALGVEKRQSRAAATATSPNANDRPAVAPATEQHDMAEAQRLAPYVEALEKKLKVEPVKENRLLVKETRLIDVRYTHPDAQVAANVVNSIADVFEFSNYERKAESASNTGEFLQKRITELQAKIRDGEERLITYAQNNQLLSLDSSQNTVLERLIGLNRQLLEAENERKQAEAAYQAALAPGAASALAESAAKEPAQAEAKIAELRQRRAQLLVENTEEWPEVKEVEQQIAVLEKYLQDTRNRAEGTVIKNLETRFRQSATREQALRASFNQQRGETLVQNEAAINYRIVQQEIETNRNLLNNILQRSKENDVLLVGSPNNVRVIDYALAPEMPIGPRRLQSLLIALGLGLGVGVALTFFLEYFDQTISSPEEVEKILHLPALAVIPAAKSLARNRLLATLSSFKRRGELRDGAGGNASELMINSEMQTAISEAYRHLRTSLTVASAGRSLRTLLVTSSLPAEGKTTTAVNTAASLALTGAKVLLIDADLRHPRLHNIFQRDNEWGLSTLLAHRLNESEALALVERDETSGLFLLPSGPIPANPAELLGSDQMARLLGALANNFDYVVIDSPPIATFTDGVLLSTVADGVLLVVHSGKSSQDVIRRSQKMLQDTGSKIFGVVLNKVSLDSYGRYVPYSQQYYYPSNTATTSAQR